jgi:hypothetical protein
MVMWDEIVNKKGCEIAGSIAIGDFTIELYGEVHNPKFNSSCDSNGDNRTFWDDMLDKLKNKIDITSDMFGIPIILFEHSTLLHNYNREEYEEFAEKTYGIEKIYFNLMNHYYTSYEAKHESGNCIVRSIIRKEQTIKEQTIKNALRVFDNRVELGLPTIIEENLTFEMINAISKIKPNDGKDAIHKIIKVTRFIRDYVSRYLPILAKFNENGIMVYNEWFTLIFQAILRQKKILDGVLRIPDLEEFFNERDYFIPGINNITIVTSAMIALTKNLRICASLIVDINIINQIDNCINANTNANTGAYSSGLIPFFQDTPNILQKTRHIIILAGYSHIKRVLDLLDNSEIYYNNTELETLCDPLEYSMSENNENQFIKKLGMAL